jgi:hypothetical protein
VERPSVALDVEVARQVAEAESGEPGPRQPCQQNDCADDDQEALYPADLCLARRSVTAG